MGGLRRLTGGQEALQYSAYRQGSLVRLQLQLVIVDSDRDLDYFWLSTIDCECLETGLILLDCELDSIYCRH